MASFLETLYQILLFLVLSVVLILATKPLAKADARNLCQNQHRPFHRHGRRRYEILPNEIGEVKIDNQLWRAVNNEGLAFQPGEKVIVDAISGIKLVVSKLMET